MIQDLVQSPALTRDITQDHLRSPKQSPRASRISNLPPIAKTGDNDLVGIMFQLIYLKSKTPYLLFVI